MYKVCLTILLGGLMLAAFVAGCSDDDNTTTPTTPGTVNPLEMVDVAAIIEQAVPPEFVAPSGSPMDIDSAWLYGQSPILEKVFGSRDPQALYANINEFKLSMGIITSTMQVDENGDIITGVYVDSALVAFGDEEVMLHFTATVTTVVGPVAVPEDSQPILGESIDIDYLITVEQEEMPNAIIKIGLKLSETEQTLWQWDAGSGDATDTESRSIYASLDPTDSSFAFRGLGYCLHEDGDMFTYAFDITADANADFTYRQSYYSPSNLNPDFLHCVVGGGNKDEEFALKYRLFAPADTTVCDSLHMYDQVFGPDYSEGTGLISAYEEYLSDDLIFMYDVIPMEMLVNPWE